MSLGAGFVFGESLMEPASSFNSSVTELPVTSDWLTTKSKQMKIEYRWKIVDFAAKVGPGWSRIEGPCICGKKSDVLWNLELVPDSHGFLSVRIKQQNSHWHTGWPTHRAVPQASLTASVHNTAEPERCRPPTKIPPYFKSDVDGHHCQLMKLDEVLANPARYLPGGKLTVLCTINWLDKRTATAQRLEAPPTCIQLPPDLIPSMGNALSEGLFSDVVLVAEEREFPAHRVILAQRSEVFKTMFQMDMTESRERRVVMDDLSADALQGLLTFVYTDSAPNVSDVAPELLAAAEKYNIPRLKAVCEEELAKRLDVSNVIDTLILADVHRAFHLKATAVHWIAKHATEVTQTESWKVLCDRRPELMKYICEKFATYVEHLLKPPPDCTE